MSSLTSIVRNFRFQLPRRRQPVPGVSLEQREDDVASAPPRRVLAIASGGGHWVQLLRLQPAFDGDEVTFVTVNRAYQADVPGRSFRVIGDATRWSKLGLLRMALQIAWILLLERPDVVVSTGAAPGYFAIRLGKWFGARTVWIDSIANVEHLSLSGQRVGPHADLWLTQWPHLVRAEGPHFLGGVL